MLKRESKTLGPKAKLFQWEYNLKNGLLIYREFKNSSERKTVFTNKDLWAIKERFKNDKEIRLANNVQKLAEGTEINGLGSFVYTVLKKATIDAQATSQLAAILVEVGIFTAIKTGRSLKFTIISDDWQDKLLKLSDLSIIKNEKIDKNVPKIQKFEHKVIKQYRHIKLDETDVRSKYLYLSSPHVEKFMYWLVDRMDNRNTFVHRYYNKRTRCQWECHSIFNAYEKYEWSFSCIMPDKSKKMGSTFEESSNILAEIKRIMIESLFQSDEELVKLAAISVLDWGGVKNRNADTINNMTDFVSYLNGTIEKLRNNNLNLESNYSDILMNSGWTKIYSLCVDDFVIYDGRVGAALGHLVKLFLIENNINFLPEELNFHYGEGKGDIGNISRRNPSTSTYNFKSFSGRSGIHLKNNIKANWILKEVTDHSLFSTEPNGLRKLEAALFMIGYDVSEC